MRSGNSFSLVGEWVMSIDLEVMLVSGYWLPTHCQSVVPPITSALYKQGPKFVGPSI